MPSRPGDTTRCRGLAASAERSGNSRHGSGRGARSGGDGATTDGGEGFGVTGVNARVSDDRLTGRGGTRALPRSRRHTKTDRLVVRVGGEGGKGKDPGGTRRNVTWGDGVVGARGWVLGRTPPRPPNAGGRTGCGGTGWEAELLLPGVAHRARTVGAGSGWRGTKRSRRGAGVPFSGAKCARLFKGGGRDRSFSEKGDGYGQAARSGSRTAVRGAGVQAVRAAGEGDVPESWPRAGGDGPGGGGAAGDAGCGVGSGGCFRGWGGAGATAGGGGDVSAAGGARGVPGAVRRAVGAGDGAGGGCTGA